MAGVNIHILRTTSNEKFAGRERNARFDLGFVMDALLQTLGPERDGERDDEIAGGDEEISFEGRSGESGDVRTGLGEFVEGDDGEEGGVFDGLTNPVARPGRMADGLGEDDVAVGLWGGEADGAGAFQLGAGDTFDAAADDFAHVGAAKRAMMSGSRIYRLVTAACPRM